MAGDSDNRNEDELLDQIDDLKARMDRLMSGGTSTSNSALLTEKPEPKAEPARSEPQPPPHSRVRDLIGPQDSEVIEGLGGEKEVVSFPDSGPTPERPDAKPPASRPEPQDRPEPRGGSVISVEEDSREVRPRVSSFDDIGSAVQEELARDSDVPAAESKKGPDLASRFGSADDEPVDSPEPDDEPEPEAVVDEVEEEEEGDEYFEATDPRSNMGKVAAIWAFTAITSGAIAALHFTGII